MDYFSNAHSYIHISIVVYVLCTFTKQEIPADSERYELKMGNYYYDYEG